MGRPKGGRDGLGGARVDTWFAVPWASSGAYKPFAAVGPTGDFVASRSCFSTARASASALARRRWPAPGVDGRLTIGKGFLRRGTCGDGLIHRHFLGGGVTLRRFLSRSGIGEKLVGCGLRSSGRDGLCLSAAAASAAVFAAATACSSNFGAFALSSTACSHWACAAACAPTGETDPDRRFGALHRLLAEVRRSLVGRRFISGGLQRDGPRRRPYPARPFASAASTAAFAAARALAVAFSAAIFSGNAFSAATFSAFAFAALPPLLRRRSRPLLRRAGLNELLGGVRRGLSSRRSWPPC